MEGPYPPSEATLVGSSEGQVSRQGSEAGSREGTCIKSRSIRVRLAALVFVLQQVVKEGAHTHLARPSTYAHLSASLHLARPHLYLIGLLTHAGPLLTGLLVGVACARGHRARWAAVGQGVAALAALMTAATALSATPTPQASRYCNVNRLMALATDPDNAALATQDPASTSCLLPDTVVVVVWVVASLITGVGVSTGYILGFPYIDDGVKREEAPMYLAVLVTSGAFGKVIGEWLGSVSQSDPEFAGAWWAGQLVWAASWLTLAAITLTLPRNLSPELKTDRTAPSPVLHPGQSSTGAASGLPRGVVLASPPPTFVPEEEEDEEEEEEEEEEETVEERELGYETDVERDSGYSMEDEEVVWREEEEEEEEERKRREKKEEEGEKVMKKKKKKKKKFNVVCCCTGWWGAVRGLGGNRVLGLSVGVDLLVGCGVGALSSWGPALYPHPPQADQYYTGISSTTAIIVGVGVGGVWVVRCRPRARTLALLLAVLVGVMAAAHAPWPPSPVGGGGAAGGPLYGWQHPGPAPCL
ncbi:uncharacterized protein LOC135095495 [Scylla paramamosain]|uniref:uncharacterized protein LOC135095495 n=1 Tax=Scylla paramamosain TaxID=85552 RepID=UPI003083CA3B